MMDRGWMPERRGWPVNIPRWLLEVQPSLSPFIIVLSLVPEKERFSSFVELTVFRFPLGTAFGF